MFISVPSTVLLLCIVFRIENPRHPLSQSDAKLKTNRDLFIPVFPRFLISLSISHWLLAMLTFVLV